jgi:hypothetical protein
MDYKLEECITNLDEKDWKCPCCGNNLLLNKKKIEVFCSNIDCEANKKLSKEEI